MSKDAPPRSPARSLARWLLQGLAPLLAGAGLLAGVLLLGGRAREGLRGKILIPLAAVDCDSPAGLSREEFLAEVQYLGNLPDSLDALAPDVAERLARAFARHPWVAGVDKVERLPPRRLRAELTFRTPVLVVCLPGGEGPGAPRPCRAVDRHGVLLPRSPAEAGLPVLVSPVAPPAGPPGTPWGDPRVGAAARTADYLLPHLPALQAGKWAFEADGEQVTLRAGRTRIRWGLPPGEEGAKEAAAPVKLRRLLDRQARKALAGRTVDVRPPVR